MATKKGIFNTLVGVIMTIVISILQLTFLYITGITYGDKINGLIRVIISFLTYLSLTEGGLALITIFSLYRPLQNQDHETVNDIINTTRKNYRHSGKIYLIILVSAAFLIGFGTSKLTFGLHMNIAFWQVALIIISLGSRELIFFYFAGAYQNLIQADQRGYLNRLIFIFSEIIMYILIISLLVIRPYGESLPMYVPFLGYFVCGILKAFVTFLVIKIEYPWLQHKKWTQQRRMLKQSWWIALNRLPDIIISNIDIILITLFLSLTTTSIYSIYCIIGITMRSIALILISSFREVFGYWIAKSGRIKWTVYTKFELYAYIIAAFLFINQFFIMQYLVRDIGVPPSNKNHVLTSSKTLFTNLFLSQPWFILLFSLKNAIQVATEPGKVIVNATIKHKETIWGSYIQALINVSLGVVLGLVLANIGWKQSNEKYLSPYLSLSLYMIIFASCIGWIYRLISIWIYVWKHLTYNSDLRFIIQNTLVLILPILSAILFGCLYFFKTYPLKIDLPNPNFTLKVAGYSLLYSSILILGLAMTINFRQFWSIFNIKQFIKNCFSHKQKQQQFWEQKTKDFLKNNPKIKSNFSTKTFDWTTTYQNSVMIDDFIEKELLRKQNLKDDEDKLKTTKQSPAIGIYKIRG